MVSRGPKVVAAAVVFLAVGLFALRFPVFIDAYDQFGWQVKCGNGFTTDLTQASNADNKQTDHQTDYVGHCNDALLIRRAWAIPAAALGGLTLTWLAAAVLTHDYRRPARPRSLRER